MANTFDIKFLADTSEVTKAVSGLQKSLKGLALTALAGFSFKKAIDEAVQAEEALNSFNIVLKQTGIFTKQTSDSFAEFADTLQQNLNISGESVLDLSAKIQTLTGVSAKNLATLTQATIDFATANNLSFETAGTLVSKAINGNAEALKRYGINIKNGKDQTESFNNTLQALGRFQGTAEERSKTFGSQLKGVGLAFNEVLETLGNFIVKNEAFSKLLNTIKNSFYLLINVIEAFKTPITFVASFLANTLTKAFEILVRTISGAIQIVKTLEFTFFKTLIVISTGLNKFYNALADITGFDKYRKKADAQADSIEILTKKTLNLREEIVSLGNVLNKTGGTKTIDIAFSSKKGAGAIGDGFAKASEQASKDQAKRLLDEQAERDKIIKDQLKQEADFRQRLGANLNAIITGLGQGKEGVIGALSSIASTFVDTIIPGFGAAAGQLLSFLAQGPDAVKSQIQAFVDNVPVIINAIAESLPVVIPTLIESIAKNAPKIISSLSSQMPVVATRFATELVANAPTIVKSFIQALISESGRLIQSIADGVKNAISNITGGVSGVGGAVGGFFGKTKKLFGFAEGGIVPGGAPFTDRVPALLTPGEAVVSRNDLKSLTNAQSNSSTGPLTIILQVGEKQLADVMVNLSRQGFRLQA